MTGVRERRFKRSKADPFRNGWGSRIYRCFQSTFSPLNRRSTELRLHLLCLIPGIAFRRPEASSL